MKTAATFSPHPLPGRARQSRRHLVLPMLLGGALAGCSGGPGQTAPPPVPVTTATVVRQTVPLTAHTIGNVEAIATVGIKSQVTGELTEVHFREGQTVREGDTLFTIDSRPYVAALQQAQAQLARDQALAKKAEADVARYKDLVAKDFVTKEQYDQIVASAASTQATVQADQANVDNVRVQLGYCTIKAPFSGRTGNLLVKLGNIVKANADTPMMTLNQLRPIYVTFTLPAQLLPQITDGHGKSLKIEAKIPNEDAVEQGTLTFVDNSVDAATATVLLKGTFPNKDDRLWPGQFIDVTLFLGEQQDRVVAPAAAVEADQQGDHVFVVKPDQTVDLVSVQVDRRDEKIAVIASGLKGGETVVTDGQLRLVPGAKVKSRDGAQPAGSEAQ
jgi:multidrug efflux system membrane fusion protein